MSNKLYDILKWIALVVLPAIGTLYFAIAGIWGFPYGEQIVGTITAFDTFLGVVLGISNIQYNRSNNNEWVYFERWSSLSFWSLFRTSWSTWYEMGFLENIINILTSIISI